MRVAGLPLLLLFAVTLFQSATLLFLVQPIIGKMLLPLLGGTPAVWNTCMVFFQALLLAGYAYAHATTALLGVRWQALLHLGVLLLPFLALDLTVDRSLLEYGEGNPITGLLMVLFFMIGLPFFVVSTSAPLLQKWFAGSGHPAAADPYFLYGASNLGSMLALFGYPLLVEPHLTLANQRLLWQAGYVALVALIGLCAISLWRSRIPDKESEARAASDPVSWSPGLLVSLSLSRRLRWVALAFVPSSLMLGVTTYITTDIAAIPLLWLLPLGLYLLSFILVFSRLPAGVHRLMAAALPLFVLPLVFLLVSEFPLRIWWRIVIHLAVLFVAAMVCHGELARDRPSTRHLTEFYLWMSVGGVLGGLFNALVAPVIFHGIVEYPLALVLACLLVPPADDAKAEPSHPVWDATFMGLLLGIGAGLLIPALGRTDLDLEGIRGELPWVVAALVAAGILVHVFGPGDRSDRTARWLDLGLPVAVGVLALGLNLGLRITTVHGGIDRLFTYLHEASAGWLPARLARMLDPDTPGPLVFFIFVVPVVLCYAFINRRLRFGLAVGALLLAVSLSDILNGDVLTRQRSFFGVLAVTDDGTYHRLEHGTTLHGQQRVRWSRGTLAAAATGWLAAATPLEGAALLATGQDMTLHAGREPLTYFHRTGPIGQVFTAYQDQLAGRAVGLVGLGSGTLASYGQPGQRLSYYEIDPLVKRIAYDPAYFTYVRDALDRGVAVDVVLGDARLRLEERARNGSAEKFALLVIDAFSSDSIPIHLITREALALYLENLGDDGLLVFHISNRYLDLEPVLGNLAAEGGLMGFIESDAEGDIPGKASSSWVALARRRSNLDRLVHEERWEQWQSEQDWHACQGSLWLLAMLPDADGRVQAQAVLYGSLLERLRAPWRTLKVRPELGVWTDDYSNLLGVFDFGN